MFTNISYLGIAQRPNIEKTPIQINKNSEVKITERPNVRSSLAFFMHAYIILIYIIIQLRPATRCRMDLTIHNLFIIALHLALRTSVTQWQLYSIPFTLQLLFPEFT